MTLIAASLLTGCAADMARKQGESLIYEGEVEQGLQFLKEKSKLYPDDIKLRASFQRQLDITLGALLKEADNARARGDIELASNRYQQMLSHDKGNYRALEGLRLSEIAARQDSMLKYAREIKDNKPEEALDVLAQMLIDNPRNTQALKLRDEVESRKTREATLRPGLAQSLKNPISLQFKDQSISSVFDIISRIGKVNFIFDRDVAPNLRTTIYAHDSSVEDVINLILTTNQLDKKVLNENTILIYPKRPDKDRDYKDLVMRTFYLSNADPKQVLAMIKQMVKTKDVYIDERLSMLVMRDTAEAVAVAERLIAAQDLPQSEIILDVEILEVTSTDLLNMGIEYPQKISASIGVPNGLGAITAGNSISLDKLNNLNKSDVLVNIGSPAVTANFAHNKGNTNILANPKIRVKNREKAKVQIGDRVPVITTTTNNGVTSESITYLDVGLTLNVEPTLSIDNDISVKVSLEVSNVTDKSKTTSGNTVYTIGTRNATTNMSARDGETQVLAGLLSRTNQSTGNALPGLGELPVLNRLFGNQSDDNKKTELILLITPRVVRNLAIPSPHITTFESGTEGAISTNPLRLRPSSSIKINSTAAGSIMMPAPQPMMPQAMPEPAPQPAPAPVAQAAEDNSQAVTPPTGRGNGMGRR
ncbi:secretin N-terminal domain-containing protein [Iodobacter fluviatilis]|uniref:General secretion pathway protein D n=1 Tax=Iodobacter fluviatilis TaxID=537 RepID=A0A377Q3X6_9NEIS|nr:secretin N-terminal domain-containing protein [Iodobacter fluviatilis]TCU90616.1 general secretion pathway protein D [Iodobacter fluviatilis]STQ89643.1 Type IV pilus biogenesis and competence protein pilQ precursor [Iodobacter fluviatilis]